GETRATVSAAPGPTLASALARRKNRTGRTHAFPPQREAARRARASRVPLTSARAKRKVTPARVTKRADGKPAATTSGERPAAKTPTSQARARAARPTLMRDVQESTIATSSAPSDQAAGESCTLTPPPARSEE